MARCLMEGGSFLTGTAFGPVSVPLRNSEIVGGWVFFFTCHKNSAGSGARADACEGLGFASSASSQFCIGHCSGDADTNTDCRRKKLTDHCIDLPDDVGGTRGRAKLVSFTAGFINLDWTATPTADQVINYWILDVDGLENVYLGTLAGPGAIGVQSYTDAGFTVVEGRAFLMLLGSQLAAGSSADNHLSPNFGVAVSSTQQGCLTVVSEDGNADSDTSRACRGSDRCGATVGLTTATHSEFKLTDWIADGFELEWVKTDGSARQFGYSVVEFSEENVAIVEETIASSGATHSTTGLSFEPLGCLRFGHGAAESSATATSITVQTEHEWCMGLAVGTEADAQVAMWAGDKDAAPVSQANSRHEAGACYVSGVFDTGALDGSLTMTSLTSDGAEYTKDAPAADEFTIAMYFSGILSRPVAPTVRPYKRDRHHVRGSRFAQRAEAA